MTPRRGEVWLLDFGEPVGREQSGKRPAVIISDNDLNEGPSGLVIVVPVTSARRDLPTHIEIDSARSGLDHASYAKCEELKSVSDHRLIARLGVVPVDAMFAMERTVRFLLAL